MAATRFTMEEMRAAIGKRTTAPAGQVIGKADVDDDGKVNVYDTTLEALSKTLVEQSRDKLQPELAKVIAVATGQEGQRVEKNLNAQFDETKKELFTLANEVRPLEIRTPDATKQITGLRHNQFENLVLAVGAGQPVLMVGPAGTGKSAAAEQAADALDLEFHAISVGSQTSKSDLAGFMHGGGGYVRSAFREAYENGGLFLLDEADAGNSNVLITLNAALSNGYMAFPDGMVKRHANFRLVATANTFGNGASRQYVGRNQLDAATLDRFAVLNWDIDDKIEEALAGGSADGQKWLKVVRAVRERVAEQLELRVVISPRATQRGALLLNAGVGIDKVLEMALTGNIPSASRQELENLAKTVWSK